MSWIQEGKVYDPSEDEIHCSFSAPHCTRLRDGTLLLTASRYDRSDPDRLMFNPETGGMVISEKILMRSKDGGRSWSHPKVLLLPVDGALDLPSQIIELSDGTLFLACEVWKSWADAEPLHIKGYVLFSEDGGCSWTEVMELPGNADSRRMYSHGRYTQMQDKRIMVLYWTQNIGASENHHIHMSVSDISGRNWSAPAPTDIPGQTSWAADLGGSLVAAAYSSREGRNPGIRIVLSDDYGQTWDLDHQTTVWDAVGQEFLGTDHKPVYPASHDNIAFGKPNLVRLSDGSLICSWWCTQACVTHTRYAKLRVV